MLCWYTPIFRPENCGKNHGSCTPKASQKRRCRSQPAGKMWTFVGMSICWDGRRGLKVFGPLNTALVGPQKSEADLTCSGTPFSDHIWNTLNHSIWDQELIHHGNRRLASTNEAKRGLGFNQCHLYPRLPMGEPTRHWDDHNMVMYPLVN